jgi:hypothetical protein
MGSAAKRVTIVRSIVNYIRALPDLLPYFTLIF